MKSRIHFVTTILCLVELLLILNVLLTTRRPMANTTVVGVDLEYNLSRLPAEGMPTLLLIHGRDQPVGNGATVEREWRTAVNEGLAKAGVPGLIHESSTLFFWYADVIDQGSGCFFAIGNGESYVSEGIDVWPTARDWFLSAAAQIPNAAERALVQLRMKDTETYLQNGPVACAIDTNFLIVLARAPGSVIVVAHSMGSMILYKNLIGALGSMNRRIYLVTIGSMVAQPAVQRTLLGSHAAYPGPVPLPVVWWRNVMNKGDLLAFAADGAFRSRYSDKLPRDILIDVPGPSRHDAKIYLASAGVGQLLRESWCLAAPNSPACRQ